MHAPADKLNVTSQPLVALTLTKNMKRVFDAGPETLNLIKMLQLAKKDGGLWL